MSDIIYRKECADIIGIDPKTFDAYVRKGLIKPDYKSGKRKNGTVIKGFEREKVVEFKKRIAKTRKPGLPLVV